MIELLVAVLVMGIGVLGITGLQMVSLQNNRGALVRAEAVQLAYDMMDRIRANPGGNYGGIAMGTPPSGIGNCNAAACVTPAEMAAFDIGVWKCSLGAYNALGACTALRPNILPDITAQPGLPSGDGSIVVIPAPPPPPLAMPRPDVVRITVRWQEPNQANPTSIVIESGR